MPTNQTTVVLIVVALVLLGAIAYMIFGNQESGTAVSPDQGAVTATELTFISLTAQIEPVSFNTSILTDPRFLGLTDLRTAIVPEALGRVDPFAPLSGVPR